MTDVITSETPRPRSKKRFIFWTVGIIVVGFMAISVLLPSLCRAREPANRVKCASNLRQIGQAILFYANDNAGQYPPSLAILPANEDIVPEVMVCPASNDEKSTAPNTAGIVAELSAADTNAPGHKHCLSYIYFGQGLNSKTVPATAIVAYEPVTNHDGEGTNILYGDGHVEWVDNKTYPNFAAPGIAKGVQSPSPKP